MWRDEQRITNNETGSLLHALESTVLCKILPATMSARTAGCTAGRCAVMRPLEQIVNDYLSEKGEKLSDP